MPRDEKLTATEQPDGRRIGEEAASGEGSGERRGRWETLSQRLFSRGPRVSPLRQDSAVECGAACLTMILNYYGRPSSLAEVHERCRVGRDGATALDIATAARTYGLRVSPYSLDVEGLRDVPCPAILHWSFRHFVVLERFTGEEARIADPALGRVTVSEQELSENFTGVVLTLEPGPQFNPDDVTHEEPSWKLVARRAFAAPGVRKLLIQIGIASLVLEVLGLAVPLLTEVLVDSVLPQQISSVMTVLGLGVVVILLSQAVTTYLRGLLLVTIQAKLDARLMVSFFHHILTLPFGYFQERSTGDLVQRLSSNVAIRNVLTNQTLSAFLDGSFVIVYGVILMIASPLLGGVALALGLGQVMVLLVSGRAVRRLVTRELVAEAASQSFMVEALTGIGSLKASGTEDGALSRWTGLFTDQIEASMYRGRLAARIGAATSTIQRFSPLIILWIGAQLVLGGSMSVGFMLALSALAGQFLGPLTSLVASGMQLQTIGGHLERIASVLRAEPEQRLEELRVADEISGQVEFDRVSFRYSESGPWVIRDFSLNVPAGAKVGLVGRSGSGKSTVAKLLLGLLPASEGAVRFDGVSLIEVDMRTLRAQCGVVMQDPTVFNGSIRSNIALHDPSLELERVAHAAALAALHDDVSAMPMGYETIVAEGGAALSGGQRQRLALARALVCAPRVLVLDEATSALDTRTESRVTQNLGTLGATQFVVAHRLSTIFDADLILVMDQGAVVEQGTHEELMEIDGIYSAMVSDQSGQIAQAVAA